jgi:transketolase
MTIVTKSPVAAEAVEMRAVYGQALTELAESDERIVVLDADLMRANGTVAFKERFPDRAIDVGVAEANMIGIAAGLSTTGLIPFPATFTCFASRRVFDQFFISANYARQNVKLTGTDPGIAALLNGGTHMSFEDAGLMRTIPGITIYEPADPVSLKSLLRQAAYKPGCCYLRLHRKPIAPLYGESEQFELGKGKVIVDGTDVAIFATGAVLVPEALEAAKALEEDGISAAVIDMHTIKPIDEELIVRYARTCGAILTCENHQIRNGLGSAVAEVLVENEPVPMARIGSQDEFGEVGEMDYLKQRFGMNARTIAERARELLTRKEGRG